MGNAAIVKLNQVEMEFQTEMVLKGISLEIQDKEFITLLGPSGCGKTTTLRIIGGFEMPTAGQVFFSGEDMTRVPPYKRPANTVFQRYALFPNLNVYENIAFGLNVKKVDPALIRTKVAKIMEIVGLTGFERRSVTTLSGGQQQRVAIARAVVNEPNVLLLDEPLSALDFKLRKQMQRELKEMQEELGITFVFVTHDQEEALSMSDRVVVMKEGLIQQIGTPEDIYNEPSNSFVADFVGDSNIISGIMVKDYQVDILGVPLRCVDSGFEANEEVDVVIRPEDIHIISAEEGELTGVVQSVTFKGVHYEIMIEGHGYQWMVHTTGYVEEGSYVGMDIYPDDLHIMHKMED